MSNKFNYNSLVPLLQTQLNFSHLTAQYPLVLGELYSALELISETLEAQQVMDIQEEVNILEPNVAYTPSINVSDTSLVKEVGDVLWGLVRVSYHLNSPIEELAWVLDNNRLELLTGNFDTDSLTFQQIAQLASSITKQYVRGDFSKEIYRIRMKIMLCETLKTIKVLITNIPSQDPLVVFNEIINTNIAKLTTRLENNSIKKGVNREWN